MQQLDENHLQNGAKYSLVGGKSSNCSRKPSYLMERRKSLPVGVLKSGSGSCDISKPATISLSRGNSDSISESNGMDAAVMRWDMEDVEDWLKEAGLHVYLVSILS